jgi:hypothetical protein
MINFKPCRSGRLIFNSVEEGKGAAIELYYSKGGANYFSGNRDRRGIYVSIMPVEVTKYPNGTSATCSLVTGGIRALVVPLMRKNDKSLQFAAEKIDALLPEVAAGFTPETKRESIAKLVDPFRPDVAA